MDAHFTGWAGFVVEPLLPCRSGRPEGRQRPRRQAQMRKYPDNHGGLLDGGDNLQVTATMRAVFDINVENELAGTFSRNAEPKAGLQCMSPF